MEVFNLEVGAMTYLRKLNLCLRIGWYSATYWAMRW